MNRGKWRGKHVPVNQDMIDKAKERYFKSGGVITVIEYEENKNETPQNEADKWLLEGEKI